MRAAKDGCDVVVVSLFVNPLQFGKNEDLSRYPRDEERDASLAEAVGVDVLFVPEVHEVYPRPSTIVAVPDVTNAWEGAVRPGHFDGVSTVVCKLFNMVNPHVAYFGQKDLQQCAVIRRMVEDLNMDLTIEVRPTTREEDGLAMSSRNVYLDPEQRARAPHLYRVLSGMANTSKSTDGSEEPRGLEEMLRAGTHELESHGFAVDYLAFVDAMTFESLNEVREGGAFIAAARIGKTRLIDNVLYKVGD